MGEHMHHHDHHDHGHDHEHHHHHHENIEITTHEDAVIASVRMALPGSREEAETEIWGLEGPVANQRALPAHVTASAHHGSDGLGAIFGLDLLHMEIDDIESFIPSNLFPRVVAAIFLRTLHRVEQTGGIVEKLFVIQAAKAQTSLAKGAGRVAFDVDELTIFISVVNDLTAIMAARSAPYGCTGTGDVPLFPLVHIISIQLFVVI